MSDIHGIQRRILTQLGYAPEHQDRIIALQDEHAEAEAADTADFRRSMDALAAGLPALMGIVLPDGVRFEMREQADS